MNEDQNNAVNELIKELMVMQKKVHNDIVNNESFDVGALEDIRDHLGDMIDNMQFHKERGNPKRVAYELVNHLKWVMENYS
jgi:hypothetical protein